MKDQVNFNTTLVPGGVKAAMRHASAASRDLWQVPIGNIRVLPNFNVRIKGDAYRVHIRGLADSMKTEGFYQDKPLAGYVAKEGDTEVIYITDGHCRFEGAQLAIREGAEIEKLPIVVTSQGTSMEDLTVSLVRANQGKPLEPMEVAVVCKRLSRFGWDTPQIASRLGFTEQYVEGLLLLMSASTAIREMVASGKVAATTAIQALRSNPTMAETQLKKALDNATANGSKKVTPKHLPGATHKKAITKAAPSMYTLLERLSDNAGVLSHLDTDTKNELQKLISELKALAPAADASKVVRLSRAA